MYVYLYIHRVEIQMPIVTYDCTSYDQEAPIIKILSGPFFSNYIQHTQAMHFKPIHTTESTCLPPPQQKNTPWPDSNPDLLFLAGAGLPSNFCSKQNLA
jgi:hypothetical protein